MRTLAHVPRPRPLLTVLDDSTAALDHATMLTVRQIKSLVRRDALALRDAHQRIAELEYALADALDYASTVVLAKTVCEYLRRQAHRLDVTMPIDESGAMRSRRAGTS